MSGIDLSPGERIREYEIVDLIGKGGMGAVYRARHVYLNCERAIKFIRPSLEGSRNFLNRFIREAKILSELSHPNLVRLYEFGELEPEIFYIVMEFITGESVRKRIERIIRIPVAESIRIIREASSALGCAHLNGIIHRDISPDNLMIVKSSNGNESTKIIDFGIAKSLTDSQALTRTDHFMGKPQYASPEQAGFMEAGEIDARSDIYSLGITFYHMLSGMLPFSSATPQGYLFKHATEIPKPISSHFPNEYFSPELEKVIAKTLTKRREERYQTMEELISDLDRLDTADAATILLDATHKSGPLFESPVLSSPKRWPKLRLHWIATFVVIVAVASFFYMQTSTTMRLEEPNKTSPPLPAPTQVPLYPEPKQSPQPVITNTKGAVRTIVLRSHPSGAEVFMDGKKIGSTPIKVEVIANDAKEFTFQLKGYDSVTGIIDKNSSDSISVRLKPIVENQ